jgi:hypothetical protein
MQPPPFLSPISVRLLSALFGLYDVNRQLADRGQAAFSQIAAHFAIGFLTGITFGDSLLQIAYKQGAAD